MADFTPAGFAGLHKDDQTAVQQWLFEHGIDPFRAALLRMDEGRFTAELYNFEATPAGNGAMRLVSGDTTPHPVTIYTDRPLDPGVTRRWMTIERELEARRG